MYKKNEMNIEMQECYDVKVGKINVKVLNIVLGPSPSSVFTFYANGVSVAPLVLVV